MNNKETLIIKSELYDLDDIIYYLNEQYNNDYQNISIELERHRIVIIMEEEDFLIVSSEIAQMLFINGIDYFTLAKGYISED